jgi:ubiquinone/menaquinone biosynthesis C-methylase UbiE
MFDAGRALTNRAVLELGTGSGRDCEYLSSALGGTYTGVEIVKPVFDELIAKGLSVVNCPVEDMPADWSGRFGFVYSRHVMEHVVSVPEALAELKRVLVPGGVIGAVTPDFPHDEPAHVSKLSLQEWVVAYEQAGFTVVSAVHHTFFCKEAHITAVRA